MDLMSKKVKWSISLGASILLLSACSKVQLEDVAEVRESVQQEVDQVITIDRELSKHEMDFNNQFQTLLKLDV